MASRIAARSTSAGTPLVSCRKTRDGVQVDGAVVVRPCSSRAVPDDRCVARRLVPERVLQQDPQACAAGCGRGAVIRLDAMGHPPTTDGRADGHREPDSSMYVRSVGRATVRAACRPEGALSPPCRSTPAQCSRRRAVPPGTGACAEQRPLLRAPHEPAGGSIRSHVVGLSAQASTARQRHRRGSSRSGWRCPRPAMSGAAPCAAWAIATVAPQR